MAQWVAYARRSRRQALHAPALVGTALVLTLIVDPLQTTTESPSSRSTALDIEPSIILLIEDDDDVRGAVRYALERAGHTVVEARDMAAGIEYLSNARQGADQQELVPMPDVVLCDMHLPDGTGFDLLRSIDEPFAVVMMTAYGDPEMHRLALQMGARESLDKPLSLLELVEAIAAAAR